MELVRSSVSFSLAPICRCQSKPVGHSQHLTTNCAFSVQNENWTTKRYTCASLYALARNIACHCPIGKYIHRKPVNDRRSPANKSRPGHGARLTSIFLFSRLNLNGISRTTVIYALRRSIRPTILSQYVNMNCQ